MSFRPQSPDTDAFCHNVLGYLHTKYGVIAHTYILCKYFFIQVAFSYICKVTFKKTEKVKNKHNENIVSPVVKSFPRSYCVTCVTV